MITENYKEGFIEQCMNAGLDQAATEQLFKKATFAAGFDDPNFLEGFERVHGEGSSQNLSPLEKADIVENALADMINNSGQE